MRKTLVWALLLIVLACTKTDAFFALSRRLHRMPAPGMETLPNYCNDTTGKGQSPLMVRHNVALEAFPKSSSNTTLDKKHHPRRKQSLQRAFQALISVVTRVFYTVKVNATILAIHLVLSLKLEGPVLRRLPPHLLLFLLEVSVSRPQVMQTVARELGERIAFEVHALTGKDDYQVGDITKAIVSRYIGKDDYQFGDLTTTTIAKVKSMFFGTNKSSPPSVSSIVSSLETDLSQKFRQGLLGNPQENSSLSSLESLLYMVTGKKEYELGDVTKAVLNRWKSQHS